MGRQKRLYPTGHFRLRNRGIPVKDRLYPVAIEYVWNKEVIRKATNVNVRFEDWNPNANLGRGGIRSSYGPDAVRVNNLLLAQLNKADNLIAEYHSAHPNQVTAQVIMDILDNKPITRKDEGKDFVELAIERLQSDYSRNRIGRSRYQNGVSGMNIFKEFLRATGKGTYKDDGIYVGEVTVELIEEYISWRRLVKQNSDATINHALTPIMKACAYAADLNLIPASINARIQDMHIVPKVKLSADEAEFDGKNLSHGEMENLITYYKECRNTRRREFIEMFLFAFHACGLRVVDVMTLQWASIDFSRKELRKVMIKTGKRHVIPLTEPALDILNVWREKRGNCKFVFDLVKDDLNIDDDESLYKARNNATKCINQSLAVVGETLKFKFPLTMHVARHTFAVLALNKGLSMSVVSRLLGHGSTDITEKVYAKFLPETLSSEVARLSADLNSLGISEPESEK